jgi:hypothetical protein
MVYSIAAKRIHGSAYSRISDLPLAGSRQVFHVFEELFSPFGASGSQAGNRVRSHTERQRGLEAPASSRGPRPRFLLRPRFPHRKVKRWYPRQLAITGTTTPTTCAIPIRTAVHAYRMKKHPQQRAADDHRLHEQEEIGPKVGEKLHLCRTATRPKGELPHQQKSSC